MAKGKSRPSGGRPPGRRGRGGTGPGPGYRPSATGGGGTRHNSAGAIAPVLGIAYALFLVLPVVSVGGIGAWLLHGYGLL